MPSQEKIDALKLKLNSCRDYKISINAAEIIMILDIISENARLRELIDVLSRLTDGKERIKVDIDDL